ncbi:lipase family protein [Leptolyngbya sp. AN02str]|uniref:lipase family protein n=1 Tax=Leptolyngbya sp. AN02str TaxID=3423363 RepID=UPI003D323DF5
MKRVWFIALASLSFAVPMTIAPRLGATPMVAQLPAQALVLTQAPEPVVEDDADLYRDAQLIAQWILAAGLLLGAIAIGAGVVMYNRNEKWYRIESLRTAVKDFEQDEDIWKALKIMDFEEYRDFETIYKGNKLTFKVNNDILCRALATHEERARQKTDLDKQKSDLEKLNAEILQAKKQAAKALGMAPKDASNRDIELLVRTAAEKNSIYAKELQNYHIETTLRDWFNKMLNGLEHFGYLIESGMFNSEDLRPWMIYWIRLIADREFKRPGASKFYDQLYTYIHEYGFSGVLKLFEQFGYRILQPPYRPTDFVGLMLKPETKTGDHKLNVKVALTMAKAAYLSYQDISYVAEISRRWNFEIKTDFYYINKPALDTQGFMIRTDEYIVLAFRGSQEIKDWQTNFKTKLSKFAVKSKMEELQEDTTPPKGQVHRGFQAAWEVAESSVIKQIQKWNQDSGQTLPLLITGHSLGGALATVAASSLVKQGFNIQGLYTFGQPRVGDIIFAAEIGQALQHRVFRFVNNNDIVPHIPPPYLPWNPFHIYVHLGQQYYFDAFGNMTNRPNPFFRFFNFWVGIARNAFEPGFSMVNDHRMEYYVSRLQKALDVEVARERMEKEDFLS